MDLQTLNKLEQLGKLKEMSVITQDEYDIKKYELLNPELFQQNTDDNKDTGISFLLIGIIAVFFLLPIIIVVAVYISIYYENHRTITNTPNKIITYQQKQYTAPTKNIKEPDTIGNIEIIKQYECTDDICGIIKNNSGYFTNIELTIICYDEDGVNVDAPVSYHHKTIVDDVDPHGMSKFEIHNCDKDKTKSYKLFVSKVGSNVENPGVALMKAYAGAFEDEMVKQGLLERTQKGSINDIELIKTSICKNNKEHFCIVLENKINKRTDFEVAFSCYDENNVKIYASKNNKSFDANERKRLDPYWLPDFRMKDIFLCKIRIGNQYLKTLYKDDLK